MEESNNRQTLKDKWGNFCNVIFDPWVFIMLLMTIVFICYSNQTDNKNLVSIITLIISLLSGILGGIVANKWDQMTELKVLVVRGNSAIRSLKLILLNISNIEKRTKDYITSIDKDNKEYKLITSNFEEVIEKCNILEEEIISSIENWTDIIPEVANLKTQIGIISEMKLTQAELEGDITILNKKIETTKKEGSKEKEELQIQLADKELDLNKTRQKLREAESKINTSVLSGLTSSSIAIGTSSNLYGSTMINNQCRKCGRILITTSMVSDGLCADCSNKSGIF
jgi:predicted  nucleic acid-binding Zn-ribbon protein